MSASRFRRGRTKTGGRGLGTPNLITNDVKECARRLVQDPTYLVGLQRRLRSGGAGPIEMLLWHYAYGKPRETMAVSAAHVEPTQPVDLSKLTSPELEALAVLLEKVESSD